MISGLVVLAFALTLIGSAHAHQSEVVGEYLIKVGWKNEPPVVGQKNSIEIIVTVATQQDKETHEGGHRDDDEEHTDHEEEMEQGEHLEPGAAASGLSEKLGATVIIGEKTTSLILVETSKLGVYHADYTPTDVGFHSVELFGEIGDEGFLMTFHPEEVEPNQSLAKTFAVSSSLDENNYTITGRSENVKALSFTIYPNRAIEVKVDGRQGGDVELTLPKNMIDGIKAVDVSVEDWTTDVQFQELSTNSSSTTIKFAVPQGTHNIQIIGAMVIPEFPVSVIIFGVSLSVVLLTRLTSKFNKK